MALHSIKEILKNTLFKFRVDGSTMDVYEAWDREMGKFAERAQVVSVKDNRIIINVNNSVYLQELTLRKKEILDKLNAALENRTIKEITFRSGSIE